MTNLILATDSYKVQHYGQYPPGTSSIYSYFESRVGGRYDEVTFFGLQYYLLKYLQGEVVTSAHIKEAQIVLDQHLGPDALNVAGWQHIVEQHGGRLPLRIKAVPEGTTVKSGNVLMTVENTCPDCFWLTNYMETMLTKVWYPTTVCSASRRQKSTILRWLMRTGDPSLIDFKLHDFGYRGVSSEETAALGGAAHLVHFKGTDTIAGVQMARIYYTANPMPGVSIAATEHSTITSWGEERECEAYENLLNLHPTGLVACVSDSYDIFKACSEHWGRTLQEKVLARNGTLVVRPDSGYPPHIVPQVLNLLGHAFGYTTNEKGYKVLDPHVRVIQGDGVDEGSLEDVLMAVAEAGWSTDNVAFGSGGALLQKWNRDTHRFAFKASHTVQNGQGRDVFKQPTTDDSKASKRGRLALIKGPTGFSTVREDAAGDFGGDTLVDVFNNGLLQAYSNFETIRDRANLPLQERVEAMV